MAAPFIEKAERSCFENNSTNEMAEGRSSANEREKTGNDMSTKDCARLNPETVPIDSPRAFASIQRRTSSAGPLKKYLSRKAMLQFSEEEVSTSACPTCSTFGPAPNLSVASFLRDSLSNASASSTAGALWSSRMISSRGPIAAKNPFASRIPYGSSKLCNNGREAIAPTTSECDDTTAFSCDQKSFGSLKL